MNEKTHHNQLCLPNPSAITTSARVAAFKQALADNLYYTRGQAAPTASPQDVYAALAYTVRDYLVDRWQRTVAAYSQNRPKFVYYLSAEYLPGRQITQNLLYTDTIDLARQALAELGFDLDQIAGAGTGTGPGQRRPGAVGRVLPGFVGDARYSQRGLRHSLRVSASSSNRSATAGRWKVPTIGCTTATRGNFRSRIIWRTSALAATPRL